MKLHHSRRDGAAEFDFMVENEYDIVGCDTERPGRGDNAGPAILLLRERGAHITLKPGPVVTDEASE